jgi:hypothetical protein
MKPAPGCAVYAERIGSAWVTQIVEEGGDVGGWPVIGTDASGRPIVVSLDFTGGGLRFADATGVPTAVRVDPAPAPPRLRFAPNPFVHATEIHLASGGEGRATLDLFNVRGERVTRIWEGILSGASISVRWDGRTQSGQAPAGIYWVRLRGAGIDERRPLIRLR